jgi:hypothetical protein
MDPTPGSNVIKAPMGWIDPGMWMGSRSQLLSVAL